MYNWLGHVLDGQPRNVLPSKGVEMKRVPMVVCGVFLDRALPFLNSKCHKNCVVEAYFIPAPTDGTKVDWNLNSRMWMPEKVQETSRQRAGTLDVLLNERKEEGDEDNTGAKQWQRRFSLADQESLGQVHIRIGLETKL